MWLVRACNTARLQRRLAAGAALALCFATPPEIAAAKARPPSRLDRLEARLKVQALKIEAQASVLASQQRVLAEQSAELAALREVSSATRQVAAAASAAAVEPSASAPIVTARAGPGSAVLPPQLSQAPDGGPTLVAPVGEAPPDVKVEVAALPEAAGVLTPRGGWYVEPSFSYTRSSANVLVFRGVEIVTGVQVGLLQANSAARDTLVESLDVRYGLTNRLEVEARAPFVSRRDRIQTVAQRDQAITQSQSLTADDVGDVELSARYQLNAALTGKPIYVAGLRYKTATGRGPFEIDYDAFGAATGLATGSGFNALEPSLSVLLPSDPTVIFAGLSYIHNFGENVNTVVGGARITDVQPGDSIGASFGFGFAVNPRFSFSLGYRHNYIYPTHTTLNDVRQRSNALQVGALTFGWSYAIASRFTLANTIELGVTNDAPDLNLVFRLPLRF